MTISGFTFLRNAHKLYYPIQESIRSILNLVDEFVVVLGEGDAEDTSRQLLEEINSPKIKIISTVWNLEEYPNGTEYAHQTDIAKQACTGDWLFYLQGDEVIHEDDLQEIKEACTTYLNEPNVEGFLFNYLHFWGDYDHYFSDHCWYKQEIRIVRNDPKIQSWRDAQSFRYYANFAKEDYLQMKNSRKLNCIALSARVFHYGWVRPPAVMKAKTDEVRKNYNNNLWKDYGTNFDYGRLDYCKKFKGTHPSTMHVRIQELDWQHLLRKSGPIAIDRAKMKHERTKYRWLSYVEENFLGGYVIGGFKNYTIILPKK